MSPFKEEPKWVNDYNNPPMSTLKQFLDKYLPHTGTAWKAFRTTMKPIYEHGFYLLPTDDKKWKRVTKLYYSNNILTVTTFDHNIREFYHDPAPLITSDLNYRLIWKRHPSRVKIKDNVLINSLDECYCRVMAGKRTMGGWVKAL